MKKFYFKLFVIFALCVSAVGCTKDGETGSGSSKSKSVSYQLGQPTIYSVDLTITGQNIIGYAYMVTSDLDAAAPDAAILFAEGVSGDITESTTTVTVSSLEGETQYKIFISVEYDGAGYSAVTELDSFTTEEYTDFVTILPSDDLYSVKMYIDVPEGSIVSYFAMDLDDYTTFITSYAWIDADFFNSYVGVQTVVTESQVVTYNGDNTFGPGQPVQILVAEVQAGELDSYGRDTYVALYDYDGYNTDFSSVSGIDANDYWLNDNHFSQSTNVKAPTLVDAPVECEVISTTTQTVTMNLTMNDQIDQFAYTFYNTATWDSLVDTFGMDGAIYYTTAYSDVSDSDLTYSATGLQIGLTYKMILVGRASSDGSKHSINIVEFAPSEPTLPAPTMKVTAIDAPDGEIESPLRVWFNIKAVSKDVLYIKYLCNDYRAWLFEYNSGYSNSYLIAANSVVDDTSVVIAAINSDEGLDVVFDSWEESTTRLLVVGVNCEETQSDAESEDSYADNTTDPIPDATPVESDLFESLKGEWTATAYRMEADDYGDYYESNVATTAQVTIGSVPSYPETLTEEVYAAYPAMTTEEVDALFEEYKISSQKYEDKVRGQNRLLCEGLDIGNFSTTYYSPFDLFYDDYYSSAVTTDDLFYDYGPKWHLQIAADGSITIPIDMTIIPPFNGYSYSYPLYLYAIEPYEFIYNTDILEFDVTLSDDGNTLTVEPKVVDGYTYYLSAAYVTYGYLVQSFVCHKLTFTRNADASTVYAAPSATRSTVTTLPCLDNYPKIKTDLKIEPARSRTRLTVPQSKMLPELSSEGSAVDFDAALEAKRESAAVKYGVTLK